MGQVLIIDDEVGYLDELVEALAFRGLRAVAAGGGAAAIDALRADPDISMVLTDMRMPDMDGLALVHAVRLLFPGRDIRFLMMTGHAAQEDMARVRAAGVLKCFSKPIAFDTLCEAFIEFGEMHDAKV